MMRTLLTNLKLIKVAELMLKEAGRDVPIKINIFPARRGGGGYVKFWYRGGRRHTEIGLNSSLLFQSWFSLVLFHEVGHILHPNGLHEESRIAEYSAWEWCFQNGTHLLATYGDVARKALPAFLSYGKGAEELDSMFKEFVTLFLARKLKNNTPLAQ